MSLLGCSPKPSAAPTKLDPSRSFAIPHTPSDSSSLQAMGGEDPTTSRCSMLVGITLFISLLRPTSEGATYMQEDPLHRYKIDRYYNRPVLYYDNGRAYVQSPNASPNLAYPCRFRVQIVLLWKNNGTFPYRIQVSTHYIVNCFYSLPAFSHHECTSGKE